MTKVNTNEVSAIKVTIVIPNYNGEKYLKVCLDSLSKQTFKAFKIIIVDNGSQDESCQIIKNKDESIHTIHLDKNYGFSKAVNEGIKLSVSPFVVLLNNDVEVEKDWLEKLVKAIQGDEKIFSCSSKMLRFNERDKIDDAGDNYTLFGWVYKRGDGQPISRFIKGNKIFCSCAGAAIYRRKVFDEIGYFDERFFAYMEDVDICYRAKIAGYKNMYCSDAIVYHVGSGTSGSKYNAFKVNLAARNNVYVLYKNMPIVQIMIHSPFLILGLIVKALFFVKRGFGKRYLEGLHEGLYTLHKVDKTKFKSKNFMNYVKIEIEIIKGTFGYIVNEILRHF